MKKILITGASGYIGSILKNNLSQYKLIGIDKKINTLSKHNVFKINLNSKHLEKFIFNFDPNIVIHLAGQSTIDFVGNKKRYLENNVRATQNLIKSLKKCPSLKKIIFSSTASVYQPSKKNLTEKNKINPTNSYSLTKFRCENILKKFSQKYEIDLIIFRFFNVCGADLKNKLGEAHEPETHLIPLVVNKLNNNKLVKIYGSNYKTKDGTCVRDYIHVMDIISAIKKIILKDLKEKISIYNLGNEVGVSVKKIINTISSTLKKDAKLKIVSRRNGDVSRLVCSSKKFFKLIGWKPKNSKIQKIINDEIMWQKYLTKKNIKKRMVY